MATLKNEKCSIEYSIEEKEVFGKDLTDNNNEPAFYTKSKRGLQKAFDILKESFNDNTTMSESMKILMDNKIKCHYWCMMD